ncbi:MAG: signal peptidase I [Chloroflexota bacterium]
MPALAAGFVALLLPLAIFLVATWLQGWQLQAVLSGSMSPTYPVGSLLVVSQIDASQVEAGMALVFEDPLEPGRIVTHRVIGPVPADASTFRTRGDANAAADPAPVPARLVRGRVLWSVSGLGSVLEWLRWPNGFVLFVGVPGLILAGLELGSRRQMRFGRRAAPPG